MQIINPVPLCEFKRGSRVPLDPLLVSSITSSDGVSRGKLKISLPARQCSAFKDLM